VRITNPKLATLEPTWRRYRGLSVLFDNPGSRLRRGVTALEDIPVDDRHRQQLYDVLADVVEDMDPRAMRDRFGFCPLPRHSYHVTVCDGPNEHAMAGRTSPDRALATAVIADLPGSLDHAATHLDWFCDAPLLRAATGTPVTLAVCDIAVWDHVLAAHLTPADAPARNALDRVARARAELVATLQARLDLRTRTWRPHVSLGYFANRRSARAATSTLGRWNHAVAAHHTPTVTFDSAAVYGFTDMASFYRLGI
jgi:hypothetical protein